MTAVYQTPDADLVRAALAGSADAADTLFARHWPAAWRAAYAVCGCRADADDGAQAGMERAFRGLGTFDASRPFGPWLRTIVVRACVDHIRPAGRDVALGDAAASVPYEDAPDLFSTRGALGRALVALPAERRIVVVLRFWADMEVPDIAAALNLTRGTASSRLARAMAELRATLSEEVHDGRM